MRCASIPLPWIEETIAEELSKVRLLGSLIVLFFLGGVIGALGFKHVGFFFTLPLAAVILLLAGMPVLDDLRRVRDPMVSAGQ